MSYGKFSVESTVKERPRTGTEGLDSFNKVNHPSTGSSNIKILTEEMFGHLRSSHVTRTW